MRALAASSLLLIAAVAFAQDAGKPADRPTQPPPYKPTAVFLLAKDTPTLDKWARSKPEARAALPLLKSVKVGERVQLGIFVDGYQLPPNGVVALTADVLITDCQRKVVLEQPSIAMTKRFDTNLELAAGLKPTIPLTFGMSDPECAYAVRVKIHDDARGMALVAEGTFDVVR